MKLFCSPFMLLSTDSQATIVSSDLTGISVSLGIIALYCELIHTKHIKLLSDQLLVFIS
jgi:hypothetical protein